MLGVLPMHGIFMHLHIIKAGPCHHSSAHVNALLTVCTKQGCAIGLATEEGRAMPATSISTQNYGAAKAKTCMYVLKCCTKAALRAAIHMCDS